MKEKGFYLAEADLVRQIYLKEELALEAVGHFHEGIEMVAVLQGEIEAFHLKHNERVKEGEIFFADSFECHHYKKITPEIKAIVMVLSNEYTSVFREIYAEKTLPTYMKNIEKNVEIIKMMQQWLNEPKKNFMLNMGYSNLLFFKIVESYELQNREGEKNKAVILNLLQYINEHYLEDISLTSVAQKIGYSKEYCSKIFSESVGMGFREYLSFLRLKKAHEYYEAEKEWQDGDELALSLYPELKQMNLNGKSAFIYGNVVLARDEQKENADISKPFTPITKDEKLVWESVVCELGEELRLLLDADMGGVLLTDYASCGKKWMEEKARISVWLNTK